MKEKNDLLLLIQSCNNKFNDIEYQKKNYDEKIKLNSIKKNNSWNWKKNLQNIYLIIH